MPGPLWEGLVGFRHKAAEDHWYSRPLHRLSKGFRKGVSHQSPVLPETVLLRGPGCRMGCVKRRHLNQKESSVNTQPRGKEFPIIL